VIAPEQIERARAVPMPVLVARDRPIKRQGRIWFALCPNHRETTPSFAVYHDHAYCFGCQVRLDPIEYVRLTRGLDFVAAVSELAGTSIPSRVVRSGSASADCPTRDFDLAASQNRLIHKLWSEASHESVAILYLRSRGLPCAPLSAALRGHEAVWASEVREPRPCLLAAVHDGQNSLVALQRIWTKTVYTTDDRDARPTDLVTRKKTLGPLGDGAVRLLPAGERLGLAEGVETALAAGRLYRRPTWATLGTARFGHPALSKQRADGTRYRVDERAPSVWIPRHVTDLIVFGDRDGGVGEEAALWAAHYYRRLGLAARAVFPEEGVKDFADTIASAAG